MGVEAAGAVLHWLLAYIDAGAVSESKEGESGSSETAPFLQVAASAGPACASALREVTRRVDIELASNLVKIKSLFGAEQLKNDGDFRYLLADAAAEAFQYGNPDILCLPLVAAHTPGQDVVDAYAEFVKTFFFGTFGASPEGYNQEYLKLTKSGPDSGDRQWWYQVCTEVAYFQVAPSKNSIRSPGVDEKYHLDLCANVFGNGTYPEVDITNLYYGGSGITATNIFFTNGSQDPWRHASKQKSSPGEPAIIMTCHNCGLCAVAHSRLFEFKGMLPSVPSPMKCIKPGNRLRNSFTCCSIKVKLPSLFETPAFAPPLGSLGMHRASRTSSLE